MITFGYKNTSGGFIRAAVAVAIGIVMIVSKANALELAVRIIAAFLVATGIVSFVLGRRRSNQGDSNLMSVNAGVDILLGVLLFLFPGFVANLIVYIVGFALLGFGLLQIVTLISAMKSVKIGLYSFIMPVLVVVAGGFLVAKPSFIGDAAGLVAGVALIVYGLSEIVSTLNMRRAMKENEPKVKDVEYEKVEE